MYERMAQKETIERNLRRFSGETDWNVNVVVELLRRRVRREGGRIIVRGVKNDKDFLWQRSPEGAGSS